eukprot:COSAG04_NODE_4180_length_2251_cov_1.585230_1_plen_358_part_00
MGMRSARLRPLAVILLLIAEWSGGLGLAAEAALHGDFAAPAQLDALPDPVREIIARMAEAMEAMRAEIAELKADRGRSQERAAALETRVGELELFMADVLEKEAAEVEARREMPAERAEAAEHRRLHAEQACASGQEFQAMTAAAMAACCPAQSAGGHRRFLQASCELPDTCPSMACAAIFVPFMEDCGAILARSSSVPLQQFQAFRASCQSLDAGAAQMLEPVNVQMFRVRVSTEGVAQSGAMFPGGGGPVVGAPLDPLQPLPPVSPPPAPASGPASRDSGECASADVATCVPVCGRSTTATSCWRRSTARTPSSAATWRTGCTPGWAPLQRAATWGPMYTASCLQWFRGRRAATS